MKTNDIRNSFLSYFEKNKHKILPSSPVIPYDDPTILFTNAGMNQFKDVFTGNRKVDYKRATTSQKCIRAGGKHNDLDNVGFTARHHTFFEMLGNFSFGDYFKEEAIKFAWEWVTKEIQLPKDKLYVSVYETDDEAFALWEKIAPELKNGRILRFGKKDNFWSMGDVGPCGPCSEIHFDRGEKFGTGPDDVVNGETERFVEFWNLVFMQYDQTENGLVDLPNPSVDTGAGLERLASLIQNVDTNYEIDLFQNIIEAISDTTKSKYTKDLKSSFHVVADHLRALTFAITDGAGISNEGQGYVLRRILRRAVRHGRILGADEPFIYKLIPTLVNEMGDAYPELIEKQSHVINVVRMEEESFDRTLDKGLIYFSDALKKIESVHKLVSENPQDAKKKASDGSIDEDIYHSVVKNPKIIPGNTVFMLYDTYGFPYDLTEVMAEERGYTLDETGFNQAMEEQRKKSRAAATFSADAADAALILLEKFKPLMENLSETIFNRDTLTLETELIFANSTDTDDGALILKESPFYVESGGQVGDIGKIYADSFEFEVHMVMNHQNYYIHLGKFINGNSGDANNDKSVTAEVNADRRWSIMRNHTVTHLTHAALRQVLGPHIKQSGSYVGPDRMRFDFSHHQPMTDEEIERIEQIVNSEILKATDVNTDVMDIENAKKTGAMALFGEKYDDNVRVVSVGTFSKELCGGTHVNNSSQIGPFFITLETGIASGVRRIEAITGEEAIKFMIDAQKNRKEAASIIGRPEPELLEGIQALKEQNSQLQKELKKVKANMFAGAGTSVGNEEEINGLIFYTHFFGETDRDTMASWIDSKKEANDPVVAVALGLVDDKMTYVGAASKAATESKIHIGNLTKELLAQFGGRGGGKPNFAQGSVDNESKPEELFETAKNIIAKDA